MAIGTTPSGAWGGHPPSPEPSLPASVLARSVTRGLSTLRGDWCPQAAFKAEELLGGELACRASRSGSESHPPFESACSAQAGHSPLTGTLLPVEGSTSAPSKRGSHSVHWPECERTTGNPVLSNRSDRTGPARTLRVRQVQGRGKPIPKLRTPSTKGQLLLPNLLF